jgi:hypothetical protein
MSNSDSMGDGPPSKKPRVGDEGKSRKKVDCANFVSSTFDKSQKICSKKVKIFEGNDSAVTSDTVLCSCSLNFEYFSIFSQIVFQKDGPPSHKNIPQSTFFKI